MRAFIWFVLFLVYLLAARWYFVCQVRQLCVDEVNTEEDIRSNTLQFRDGEKVVLRGYDQFRFDSAALQPVINENNFEFLGKVGEYLDINTDRNLIITAGLRLGEKEIQEGFFDNLGVARANVLRSMFVANRIDEGRITLDYFVDSTNALRRPVEFMAFDTTQNQKTQEFTFTHMTFSDANFEYNSAVFNPGPAFQAYADSVKLYFEQVDTVTLSIIGHTDSIASQAYNNKLGKARAESAQAYFAELGLLSEKIQTQTKGEDEPVAPNRTEEGRQKNRRVEIVIQ